MLLVEEEEEAYSLSIGNLSLSNPQTITVTAAHLDAWRERGLPADGQPWSYYTRGVQLATEAGCE